MRGCGGATCWGKSMAHLGVREWEVGEPPPTPTRTCACSYLLACSYFLCVLIWDTPMCSVPSPLSLQKEIKNSWYASRGR